METAALRPFSRPHHQKLAELLDAFNADLLLNLQCYFGGGTAIALMLDEYRESVDVDFLCSSVESYRTLRNILATDLSPILRFPVKHLREVKSDQYKILTFVEVGGTPIKVEFVREGNTQLKGQMDERLGVPVLSRTDMWAQKLMANADRALDKGTMNRDIIDLAMMLRAWGPLPHEAFDKAFVSYGGALARGFHNASHAIADRSQLLKSMRSMGMNLDLADEITVLIDDAAVALPLSEAEKSERDKRIAGLAQLEFHAGPPFTLGRAAAEALSSTKDATRVNWAEVERRMVREAIGIHGQDVHKVIDTIANFSPASVSPARVKAVSSRIEHEAHLLEAECRANIGEHLAQPD